jgi:hypothetical protein
LGGRGKAVQIKQRGAIYDGVADLDDAAQTEQTFLIDFIAADEFGVIAEVAQEPIELPQSFGCAVEATRYGPPGEMLGLDHGHAQKVVRLLLMPILSALHANQVEAVGNFGRAGWIRFMQALDATSHAAPSCARG